MEFEEVEIMPGIYMTDFRKKKKENSGLSLTAEEYKTELMQKGLAHTEYLRDERERFELKVSKLKETNEELKGEEGLEGVIEENQQVIDRFQGYLKVIGEMLGEGESVYL